MEIFSMKIIFINFFNKIFSKDHFFIYDVSSECFGLKLATDQTTIIKNDLSVEVTF